MKHVLSALFLVVFGLAISASADDVEMSPNDVEALERVMAEAPLETQVLTDADFEDDDELSTKVWNPITWIKNQYKNKCVCENNKCNCCFKVSLFKKTACLSAELLAAEQNINVSFGLDDKQLVDKKFSLRGSTSVCGGVPVPGLTMMKFCLTQQSSVAKNGAINTCSSIEFKVGGTTGAILTFKCLELKGGKITIGGHQQVEKSAMFVIKASNPFKGLFK